MYILINLFKVISINQYIISPITWIHKISYSLKISITIIYLCFIPYLNYIYLIISLIIYIIVAKISQVPQKYLINSMICYCILVLHLLYIYIINIYKKTIQKLIYFLYMFRGIIIYIISLGLIQLLFLTTTYEAIVAYFALKITNIHKSSNIKIINNNYILTFMLTFQFIFLLKTKINIMIKSIYLRNIYNNYIYIRVLQILLITTLNEIKDISSVLFYRKINYR